MFSRYAKWCIELIFVISFLLVLKRWVFPFFISIWFGGGGISSTLYDWTMIIVGIISLFIYFGLGSTARYTYQLRLWGSVGIFLLMHLLLFIPGVSLFGELRESWYGLVKDMLSLFLPKLSIPALTMFPLYFACFLLGRMVYVTEQEAKEEVRLYSK